jgi:choline dehydrogenase-like flavoprotein
MIWDIIIAGGGIAGSVLSTRLAQSNSSLNILLIEAGKNVSGHPLTSAPLDSFAEHYSELDWAYSTVPQVNVNNRKMYAAAGKALSGGSATNYGTWTRGNAADFNYWATLVGDQTYNYDGWLEYFKRTETYNAAPADTKQHGHSGPITEESITSSSPNRKYLLREPLQTAWDAIGVKFIPDGNDGTPIGRTEAVEDFKNGTRQLASEAYGLGRYKNVQILTDTMVQRVLFETKNGMKTAVGVELANGTQFKASDQVILSTGAYRTPQILQLSGVGPSPLLKKFNIPVVVDAPEVGKNFHDHFSACQWWKTRKPGLAVEGSGFVQRTPLRLGRDPANSRPEVDVRNQG